MFFHVQTRHGLEVARRRTLPYCLRLCWQLNQGLLRLREPEVLKGRLVGRLECELRWNKRRNPKVVTLDLTYDS